MTTDPTRTRRFSPAVYRRRRLVLVVALVAVIAVLWLLIAQPWRGAADTGAPRSPSPTASASATPMATSTPSPEARPANPGDAMPDETAEAEAPVEPVPPAVAVACTSGDVLVEPVTDKESYATDEQPQLGIRLTNRSAEACTLNVGTTQQVLTVTSGNDVWWRSTDCQSEPSDMIVTLAPAQVVESSTPIAWDRTRSSVDTCGGERAQAPGGGASYHVRVSIGGIAGASTKQIFLS